MKKICRMFSLLCCVSLLSAFLAVPAVMAQPDPQLDNPRIGKDLRVDPHHAIDPRLKKDPQKEDEIKPVPIPPKAAAPGIKPIHDGGPQVGEPVPPNHINTPNDPERIKPVSPNPDHPKKIHISGKRPHRNVKHANVMRKGVRHVSKNQRCRQSEDCMACCTNYQSVDPVRMKTCQRICHKSSSISHDND